MSRSQAARLLVLLFCGAAAAATAAAATGACVQNPFMDSGEAEDFRGIGIPLQIDTLGGCRICAVNGTVCERCWDGYGLNSARQCVQCDAAEVPDAYFDVNVCSACKGDDPTFCTDCSLNAGSNYFLWYADQQGTCQKCNTTVKGCIACALVDGAPACTRCQVGVPINGSCTPCSDENCWRCDGDPNRCSPDGCGRGYTANAETGKCDKCQDGCVVCDSPTFCRLCDGFGLWLDAESGTCVPCASDHCSLCQTSPDVCTFCFNLTNVGPLPVGLNPETQSCEPCPPGCAECSTTDACDLCERLPDERGPYWGRGQYWSPEERECLPCTDRNCGACESCARYPGGPDCAAGNATDSCISCVFGWTLDGDGRGPCNPNVPRSPAPVR